jgi:hypothetical protein
MDSRQEIEQVLDRAYAARQRQDVTATVACFHADGSFTVNGAPADGASVAAPSLR